jgi:hypothetical protein
VRYRVVKIGGCLCAETLGMMRPQGHVLHCTAKRYFVVTFGIGDYLVNYRWFSNN